MSAVLGFLTAIAKSSTCWHASRSLTSIFPWYKFLSCVVDWKPNLSSSMLTIMCSHNAPASGWPCSALLRGTTWVTGSMSIWKHFLYQEQYALSICRKHCSVRGGDCWKALVISAIMTIKLCTAADAKNKCMHGCSMNDAYIWSNKHNHGTAHLEPSIQACALHVPLVFTAFVQWIQSTFKGQPSIDTGWGWGVPMQPALRCASSGASKALSHSGQFWSFISWWCVKCLRPLFLSHSSMLQMMDKLCHIDVM